MDTKNVIAAISLSAAVIILYGLFFAPTPPDPKQIQVEKNTITETTDAPSLDKNEQFSKISREEAINTIVDNFNKSNQWGITVNAGHQGHYGQIYEKMLTVVGTSEVPDIVVAYQNQAADYYLATGDGLVDMRPLVNSAKWGLSSDELGDFYEGFLKQDIFPSLGGVRLGFPPKRSMELLYYNEDWLTELGYSGSPKTPEEFMDMACAATKQPFSKATTPESSVGWLIDIDASTFASLTFAYGGDVFDKEAVQYTYDSPEAIKAGKLLHELASNGCMKTFTEKYSIISDALDKTFSKINR